MKNKQDLSELPAGIDIFSTNKKAMITLASLLGVNEINKDDGYNGELREEYYSIHDIPTEKFRKCLLEKKLPEGVFTVIYANGAKHLKMTITKPVLHYD